MIERGNTALLQDITRSHGGLKKACLLEAGFDDVTPNTAKDISSWLYDHAAGKVESSTTAPKGSRATIPDTPSSKNSRPFRQNSASNKHLRSRPIDFMRHYYDVYSLLQRPEVQAFIGTEAYKAHKAKRFRGGDNQNIAQNEAFILSEEATRRAYAKAYEDTSALYYDTPPKFDQILKEIASWTDRL